MKYHIEGSCVDFMLEESKKYENGNLEYSIQAVFNRELDKLTKRERRQARLREQNKKPAVIGPERKEARQKLANDMVYAYINGKKWLRKFRLDNEWGRKQVSFKITGMKIKVMFNKKWKPEDDAHPVFKSNGRAAHRKATRYWNHKKYQHDLDNNQVGMDDEDDYVPYEIAEPILDDYVGVSKKEWHVTYQMVIEAQQEEVVEA